MENSDFNFILKKTCVKVNIAQAIYKFKQDENYELFKHDILKLDFTDEDINNKKTVFCFKIHTVNDYSSYCEYYDVKFVDINAHGSKLENCFIQKSIFLIMHYALENN